MTFHGASVQIRRALLSTRHQFPYTLYCCISINTASVKHRATWCVGMWEEIPGASVQIYRVLLRSRNLFPDAL